MALLKIGDAIEQMEFYRAKLSGLRG